MGVVAAVASAVSLTDVTVRRDFTHLDFFGKTQRGPTRAPGRIVKIFTNSLDTFCRGR